jgi:hypothetical protein
MAKEKVQCPICHATADKLPSGNIFCQNCRLIDQDGIPVEFLGVEQDAVVLCT